MTARAAAERQSKRDIIGKSIIDASSTTSTSRCKGRPHDGVIVGCRAVRPAVGAAYRRPPVYAFLRIGKRKLTQRRAERLRHRACRFPGRRRQPDTATFAIRHLN